MELLSLQSEILQESSRTSNTWKNRTHQQTDAIFVGYEDQENLGLRYIMATLAKEGFRSELIPHTPENPEPVIRLAKEKVPLLMGFSLIFQYAIDEIADLTSELRKVGVRSHFTVGGHFPSIRPREALESMPCIDSVVRFEGELTTVELLRHIETPEAWDSIEGMAFRRGDEIVVTPPRHLVNELDRLPSPIRSGSREIPRNIRVASLLASRGCLYNCSFCSIRQFYGTAPGPLRRIRSPKAVVDEMRTLYKQDGIRFFIFQDDDFAAKTGSQRRWVTNFLDALDETGLSSNIRWKISCRVDDVNSELLRGCQNRGLIYIYLGVESGNDAGLITLNKQITVNQNIQAIETLKRIGVSFDMGFMMFDPDSTINSVRQNIRFLRRVTSGGVCPADFGKMLPYAGTPIESRLASESRLRGTLSMPDYDFLDPRLDRYANFVAKAFRHRSIGSLGLLERLRFVRFDYLMAREFETPVAIKEYGRELARVVDHANLSAFKTLEEGLNILEQYNHSKAMANCSSLDDLVESQREIDIGIQYELDDVLSAYAPILLRSYFDEYQRKIGSP
jgi:anaerobic magnesium-protoporphyrin IX monomethyl ester cyclase